VRCGLGRPGQDHDAQEVIDAGSLGQPLPSTKTSPAKTTPAQTDK
jgi:hypothetical protein